MTEGTECGVPAWARVSARTLLAWAAQSGREVDFEGRQVGSEELRSVCLGGGVTAGALRLCNAVFADPVDLGGAELGFVLQLVACRFDQLLDLRSTRVRVLDLRGSRLARGLSARGLQVESDALLGSAEGRSLTAGGPLWLNHARIGGDLDLSGAQLAPAAGEVSDEPTLTPLRALSADCAEVGGSLRLGRGFTATATVNLAAAQVCGDLDCIGGHFLDRGDQCLFAQGLNVRQNVALCSDYMGGDRGQFEARGCVSLARATVGGQLLCEGGQFSSASECLFAQSIHVQGGVLLGGDFRGSAPAGAAVRDETRAGSISFSGATIDGSLLCRRGTFVGWAGEEPAPGHFVSRAGSFLWLRSEGEPTPHPPTLASVDLRRATVRGDTVFQRRCHITGALACAGARFEGDLRLQGATFGCVGLAGAQINGTLEVAGDLKLTLTLAENRVYPLDLRNARVATLCDCFGPVEGMAQERGRLYRLAGLTCEGFDRDMRRSGRLLADWIRAADQRSWQRHGPGQHHVHVYSGFAQILRAEGLEVEAAELAVRQRRDGREWHVDRAELRCLRDGALCLVWLLAVAVLWLRGPSIQATWRPWLPWLAAALAVALVVRRPQRTLRAVWNLILDLTVGYGYRPSLALVWLIAIWAGGTALYHAGWEAGAMVPGAEALVQAQAARGPGPPLSALPAAARAAQLRRLLPPEYPPFHPWAYVLDRLLPIVQFGYARHWMPEQHSAFGQGLFVADWLLTGCGWLLSLLFAGAVSGLLRRP